MKVTRRIFALLLVACLLLTNGSLGALAENPQLPVSAPEGETEVLRTPDEPEALLTLPTSVESIENEAFAGDKSLGKVVLPDRIKSIGRRAFAESSITEIKLPDSLTSIDDTAFDDVEDLTVTANVGTYAYDWAVRNKLIVPAAPVAINVTNFPDEAFRGYVKNMADLDGDDSLSPAEITAVKRIEVPMKKITSLQGIGFFTALEELNCMENALTTLDLSANTNLKSLDCRFNSLTALNLSKNTALTSLFCGGNSELGSLDVSANTALEVLGCFNCGLTKLELDENTALKRLICERNALGTLDLSANTALEQLSVGNCGLNALNLEDNKALVNLNCRSNALGTLTLTQNTALKVLDCANCGLTGLDLSKNTALVDLDCSSNPLGTLSLSGNPALLSLNCAGTDLATLVLSANTVLTSLECGENSLTALDLSYNPALTHVDCSGNRLETLRLSQNGDLRSLLCDGNDIASLDITPCRYLTLAFCLGREQTDGRSYREYRFSGDKGYLCLRVPYAAVVTAPTASVTVDEKSFPDEAFRRYVLAHFDNNADNALDIGELTAVTELELGDCGIVSLAGIQYFTALETLDCSPADIQNNPGTVRAINLNENVKLRSVNLCANPIRYLDTDDLELLESLNLGHTQIQSIGLWNNPRLRELWVDHTGISSLNLSENHLLEHLDCIGCENLTSLDISACPKLFADYRAGERQLGDDAVVYGGSGDDYHLAVNIWTQVYDGSDPVVISMAVEPITRYDTDRESTNSYYDGYRWVYTDEPWQQINCWPDQAKVTLSLLVGDNVFIFDDSFDQVQTDLANAGLPSSFYWSSDETPTALWTPDNHIATLHYCNQSANYPVYVLPNPIASVSVSPMERYIFDRTREGYYDENGNYVEGMGRVYCGLRDEIVTLNFQDPERESVSGTIEELATALGEPLNWDWETEETATEPWEAGPHTARITINGRSCDVDVTVLPDPIVSVSAEPVSVIETMRTNELYDSQNGWTRSDFARVNAVPETITVITTDEDKTYTGSYDGFSAWMSEQFDLWPSYGWYSAESEDAPWTASEEPYTATFCVGTGDYAHTADYSVTVEENPIASVVISPMTRYEIDRCQTVTELTDGDGDFYYETWDCVNCEPDGRETMTVTFRDTEREALQGPANEVLATLAEQYEVIWETDETPGARWSEGEYSAAVIIEGGRWVYPVTVLGIPVTGMDIPTVTRLIGGSTVHEDGYYQYVGDDENGTQHYEWVKCDFDRLDVRLENEQLSLIADGKTYTGTLDEILDALEEDYGFSFRDCISWESSETPLEPWDTPDGDGEENSERRGTLYFGKKGWPYRKGFEYGVRLVGSPVAAITADDVNRSVNSLSAWKDYEDEDGNTQTPDEYWRIRAIPDSITVTLADGWSFPDGEQSRSFASTPLTDCLTLAQDAIREATELDYTLNWNSAERHDDRWTVGTVGNAWVELCYAGWSLESPYTVTVTEAAERVTLVTDGPAEDRGFNQSCYDAALAFCADNGVEFEVFQPEENEDAAELVGLAAELGSSVIIAPGFMFSEAVAELAPEYPDVRFILLDTDTGGTIPENVYCAQYRSDLAGYMAGYAAVKLGYHDLGFLGGMDFPSVRAYGYGFIRGAADAANQLQAQVSVKYAYAGQFGPDDWIRDEMAAWYQSGTKVIFACGGGIGDSVAEAARANGKKIIGVDVDQADSFGGNITLTSAMKCLGVTVEAQLAAILDGRFAGGVCETLGVVSATPEENHVQLAPSTQFGSGFTEQDYAALVAGLFNGSLAVNVDLDASPVAQAAGSGVTVTNLGTLNRAAVWVAGAIAELTENQIERFHADEENPAVNTVVVEMSESDAADAIASGEFGPADIFCFPQDQLANLIGMNALSPVPADYADGVTAANTASAVSAATLDGKLYAYPMTADNGYFLYYDKRVIQEEHLGSLEQILADCESANKNFCMELSSGWYLVSFFFGAGCRSDWTPEDGGWQVTDTFDSANGLIAARAIRQTAQSTAFISSSSAERFFDGAAAVVSGTWDYETAVDALGDNLGVSALPSFTVGGNSYHLSSFMGCKLLGVRPQANASREAALHALARYLTAEEAQIDRFETVFWGPSNISAQTDPAVQSNPGLAALLSQNAYAVPQGQYPGFWWNVAAELYDALAAAQSDDDLQAALTAYSNALANGQ